MCDFCLRYFRCLWSTANKADHHVFPWLSLSVGDQIVVSNCRLFQAENNEGKSGKEPRTHSANIFITTSALYEISLHSRMRAGEHLAIQNIGYLPCRKLKPQKPFRWSVGWIEDLKALRTMHLWKRGENDGPGYNTQFFFKIVTWFLNV